MKKSRWEDACDWFRIVVWKPLKEKDQKQSGRHTRKRTRRQEALRRRREKRILIVASVVCVAFVLFGVYLLLQDTEDKKAKAAGNKQQEQAQSQGEGEDGESQGGEDQEGEPAEVSAIPTPIVFPEMVDLRAASFCVQPGNVPGTFEAGEEKVVYLTFDDGPSHNTERVLEILDRYQVKATFFITGQWTEYKTMIKEAYDKGHTIGIHTYSHDYARVYSSVDAYFEDLQAAGELVREQIGYVPCFIRFPGGASNTISANYTQGIMTQLVSMVQERGYQYYDWNADSGDGGVCTTEQIIQNSTSYSQNKIMLLCHDTGAKDSTVEALPTIIEYFLNQGYTFKAIDRESYVVHHGVFN